MPDIRIVPANAIMSFTSSLNFIQKITQDTSGSLNLYGSGSTGRTEILSVDGNNGRLFTVSDDLSDSLFSVNTIAGLPVIEAFANNSVNIGQYTAPPIKVTGSLAIITGSLLGTASYATQALSASWAPATTTAATASFVTSSNVYGPNGSNSILSASFASTAGNAATATSASMASLVAVTSQDTTPVTYNLTFVGQTSGNASLAVDATTLTYNPNTGIFATNRISATSVTASLQGTASYASQALSASYAVSSSNALTASFVVSSSYAVSSSNALTASWATNVTNNGVTSVSASGTVSGITLGGGPITSTGTLTLSGTVSGLTNSNLSGTAGITNANLATPSLMIGTTNIALGATGSSLAGLTTVTATAFTGSFSGSHFGPLTGTASYATNALTASTAVSTPNAFTLGGSPFVGYVPYANASLTLLNTSMYYSGTSLGIGTTSPSFPLSFGTGLGNKIALYDAGSGNGYGFGIQTSLLQIFSNASGDDITFGYGNSTALTRNVTFKGTGNVGIGTTNPTSGVHVVRNASGPVGYTNLCAIFGDNTASGSAVYTNSVGVAGRVLQTGSRAVYGDASTGGGWAGYFDGKGYFSGSLGISIDSPQTKLHIEDVTKTLTNNVAGVAQGTLSLVSTDAQAADTGASLVFGGNYINSSSTRIAFAGITGRKENSSSVNADGYLSFLTWRSTGLTEAMRINSLGSVGIGVTSIQGKLHVAQNTNLGGTTGNSLILQTLTNTGGSGGNLVHIKDYAVRDATGTDWTTWRHHNSIDIDGVYNTPGTNTRCFWERDPLAGVHYFGNSTTTTLTVDATNNSVGIGAGPETGVALIATVSNNAFGSTAVLNNSNSGTSALAQLQFRTANQTGTPFIIHQFNNGAAVALTNVANANLTIGTNNTTRVTLTSGGAMGLGGITPTNTNGRFEASNDIVAYSSSDKNWKKNIKNINSPLEKLSQINGVEFDWIEDEPIHGNKGHDVGVIAQEIEQILPEAVQTRESGMKAVKYEKVIPLLIEAIKEQQKQIDELKQIVNGITG